MQVTHSISFNIALREYFVSFMSNFEFQNLQNDGIENQKKILERTHWNKLTGLQMH